MAHLTPREHCVRLQVELSYREIAASENICPVDNQFKTQMIETFYETFQDSVEFCNWPVDKITAHARKNINDFFEGKRGRPLPVSVMALESESRKLIGLALFLENKDGNAELDLLFVKPSFQGKGIATQMVNTAANQLYDEGTTELHSAYHICNEGSRKWHIKFGFKEMPDQFYCRMKYSWYGHEIWRLERLDKNADLDELKRERDRWHAQLDDDWKY